MHGNTVTTANGYKTRSFDEILRELAQAFEIHRQSGSMLGGVHFELTGDNVTECVGGARGLGEADLQRAYTSDLDPGSTTNSRWRWPSSSPATCAAPGKRPAARRPPRPRDAPAAMPPS